MSQRTFALPLVALSLSLTAETACNAEGDVESQQGDSPDGDDPAQPGDPLIGLWLLTSAQGRVDGESLQRSIDGYSYTYDGCTYSYWVDTSMSFADHQGDTLQGVFTQEYNERTSGTCRDELQTDSHEEPVAATSVNERVYEIVDDGDHIDLNCTLTGDLLSCTGQLEQNDVELDFERQ